MERIVRSGAMAAGILALALLFVLRNRPLPEGTPAAAARSDPPALPERPTFPTDEPARRPADPAPFAAILSSLPGPSDPLPPGVLTGTITVDVPSPAPAALEELKLTESQRTVVEALLARRDGLLAEIRREAESGGNHRDLWRERAQNAHADFVASMRGTLLPEQSDRFDALVRSGRWGGYVLLLPAAR